ncbi:ABC transporter ATP-binding protein [Streptomyces reniochalinae]|uniref:ABC transporter ATP-binding protein n=1 Tax=Streptomyces reniochalinae TaxID=2250578 RepID=UPI001FE5CF87|nr:ABC transporter ATP-binding protein [Streptomyces reniochalinae]
MADGESGSTREVGHDPQPHGGVRVPVLEVEDLSVELLRPGGTPHLAVERVSFTLYESETLALIGESGSGKSLTAMAVLGLLPGNVRASGSARYRGTDLLTLSEAGLRALRGKHLATVFQDSLSALNPTLTVGFQIAEVLRVHRGLSRRAARSAAVDLLDRVRIPDPARRYGDHPHQFSGGMRQRAMIAMAVALGPDVLIADEPTTALDVTVQAQIMELLAELREEHRSALLLITHDLGLAAGTADRVALMYAGRIVEQAPAVPLYERPAHPYTRGLLNAVPSLDAPVGGLVPVPGAPPAPGAFPGGCVFHPRCPSARDRCATQRPELEAGADGRTTACHYPLDPLDPPGPQRPSVPKNPHGPQEAPRA